MVEYEFYMFWLCDVPERGVAESYKQMCRGQVGVGGQAVKTLVL